MSKIVLSRKQISELAKFADEDGHDSYTLTYVNIPEQAGLEAYSGLAAISCSENGGVLELDD